MLRQQMPSSQVEQRCVRLDGEFVDVEVTGIPFTSGGKSAIQAVFRDVTEQKRAREALKETEKRLRTVIGSASLILFATDKNGVFTLLEGEGLNSLALSRVSWWANQSSRSTLSSREFWRISVAL